MNYFDDPGQARALEQEALSWIGTPFMEYYREEGEQPDLKGTGGGIDCIGLVQEIYARTGAAERFLFKRVSADYQSHQTGEKILDWLRGKAQDPQSKKLADLFMELSIPFGVREPHVPCPRDFFCRGDILVMQHGSLFHLPLIYDNELHFVNALPRLGVVEGTIQDSSYSTHLVAVFRLRQRKEDGRGEN